MQKGLNSVEGYLFNEENVSYLTPPVYPLQAEIAFDGSLIPLRGNPAVSFVSRGADTLNVEVARIRPDELNHLMTQTYGSYDRPGFNSYNFTEENISEIFGAICRSSRFTLPNKTFRRWICSLICRGGKEFS